jgi:hypothetical protein
MMPSREEEAGLLYEQGAKAVRTGGHELGMLAGHLSLMVRGTATHKGPLWPVRILPPDGREIRLDRFIDYLRKPMREGLGLPSLYFLRQVLKASPTDGEIAFALVREELAKEHVNFDAVADQERDTNLLKREVGETGRPAAAKGVVSTPLPKGDSTERRAAQLAKRRPDLAEQVRAGQMKLSKALNEAGIRKKPDPLNQIHKLWFKLDSEQRRQHLDWTLKHCATCGKEGAWNPPESADGMWCDNCCTPDPPS